MVSGFKTDKRMWRFIILISSIRLSASPSAYTAPPGTARQGKCAVGAGVRFPSVDHPFPLLARGETGTED